MTRFFPEGAVAWRAPRDLPNAAFTCGYCNTTVSSVKGYKLGVHGDASGQQVGAVYLCPNCGGPVFHAPDGQKSPHLLWADQSSTCLKR